MRKPSLPRTVWMLGLVSLFMDMSSEFIHAVLPVYLTTTLGLSVLTVGVVEGIAEATASIMKVFSGVVSDHFRQRKVLVLVGYGLAALTKPVFPLAQTALEVVAARFIDRIGKGIRGAPRDALVADVTPPALLNAAYGLRQSLDTAGAFAGPLLAMLVLYGFSQDLRLVLWVAVVPALVCVGLILWGVQESEAVDAGKAGKPRLHWRDTRQLPAAYWWLLVLVAVVTLARMTDALLVLRGQENGLGMVWVPLVLVVHSAVYALSAYPAGLLGNRLGQSGLLLAGMLCLTVSQLTLALAVTTGGLFWAGIVLWGLHMGLTRLAVGTGSATCAVRFARHGIRAVPPDDWGDAVTGGCRVWLAMGGLFPRYGVCCRGLLVVCQHDFVIGQPWRQTCAILTSRH